MLFLGPIYNLLARIYATRINHFALIKLTLVALDKTCFYFLLFAIVRLLWLLVVRRRRSIPSEASVWVFAFYMILVLMLTTFRNSYFPWQIVWHLHRPLDQINLVFFKETWKLVYARSQVDFIYNSFGNILCFLPFGLLMPIVFSKHRSFWLTLFSGMLFSLLIETLQFFLETGVSDIDDVFFNTVGAALGYGLFWLCQKVKNNF